MVGVGILRIAIHFRGHLANHNGSYQETHRMNKDQLESIQVFTSCWAMVFMQPSPLADIRDAVGDRTSCQEPNEIVLDATAVLGRNASNKSASSGTKPVFFRILSADYVVGYCYHSWSRRNRRSNHVRHWGKNNALVTRWRSYSFPIRHDTVLSFSLGPNGGSRGK